MTLLFDSLIIGFLVLDVILIAVLIKKFKTRLKVFIPLVTLAILAFVVIFYGSFIEPRLIVVREQSIYLGNSTAGMNNANLVPLRAVLISDIHVGPFKKIDFVEKVVLKINELKPDIIFMTGDFVFDKQLHTEFLTPFKNLKAPLGIYAVLGNHDYGRSHDLPEETDEVRAKSVRNALESLGIKMLVNDGEKIQTPEGKYFYVLGVDELWTGRADVKQSIRTFPSLEPPRPNILLCHNPDFILETENLGINLMLSGHTHGGQIRLPLIGPVPPLPDKLGRKYDRGLFTFDKTQLFITSGLGEIDARARLFNPPEIVLLNIYL